MHQRGKAADEINAAIFCRPIHSNGQRHIGICVAGIANDSHRGYGDALIHNGNTELPFDLLAYFYKVFRTANDLFIDPIGADLNILVGAIQKRNAHGNGTDIQMPLVDHILGR